jgi:glycosidase
VLKLIRDHVKLVSPDAPIIGEVWEDAIIKESYGQRRNYALGHALDSVMNYPLRVAALDFIHHRQDAYGLRNFLISQQMNYPKPMYYALMNLLGSHDIERLRNALATNVNLRSLPREQQVSFYFSDEAMARALEYERLCAVLQFSIPGVPSVYYGDEQGMTGVNDPFNRGVFKEGDKALHDFYAELAALRNSAPALSTGHAEFMTECRDVLLILRYITDGKDAFGMEAENGVYLSVINRSEHACQFTADCSAAGLGKYSAVAAPLSAKIIRLA